MRSVRKEARWAAVPATRMTCLVVLNLLIWMSNSVATAADGPPGPSGTQQWFPIVPRLTGGDSNLPSSQPSNLESARLPGVTASSTRRSLDSSHDSASREPIVPRTEPSAVVAGARLSSRDWRRLGNTLRAIDEAVTLTLHNISNFSTPGFKRLQTLFRPGAESLQIRRVSTQGDLRHTGQPLDLAIKGAGFFAVRDGQHLRFTRSGALAVSPEGALVMAARDRVLAIEPRIQIPSTAVRTRIRHDGLVTVEQQEGASAARTVSVGRIELARFVNPATLLELDGNLFNASDESGSPRYATAGTAGCGTLHQGFLEDSNVHLETESALFARLQQQRFKLAALLQGGSENSAHSEAVLQQESRSALAALQKAADDAVAAAAIDLGETVSALMTARNVIVDNLANVGSVGFKRSRVMFGDASDGESVGRGARVGATLIDLTQGELVSTGQHLHLAIQGDGFFMLRDKKRVIFTRNGLVSLDKDSRLVVKSGNRSYLLQPTIKIPVEATALRITEGGRVRASLPRESEVQDLGVIQLARFLNASELRQIGSGVFRETLASGRHQAVTPGEGGLGSIRQGWLESSNVDVASEKADLERLEQQYEAIMLVSTFGTTRSRSRRADAANRQTRHTVGRPTRFLLDSEADRLQKRSRANLATLPAQFPSQPLPRRTPLQGPSTQEVPEQQSDGSRAADETTRQPGLQQSTGETGNESPSAPAQPRPWYKLWQKKKEDAPMQPGESPAPVRRGFGIGYPGR